MSYFLFRLFGFQTLASSSGLSDPFHSLRLTFSTSNILKHIPYFGDFVSLMIGNLQNFQNYISDMFLHFSLTSSKSLKTSSINSFNPYLCFYDRPSCNLWALLEQSNKMYGSLPLLNHAFHLP